MAIVKCCEVQQKNTTRSQKLIGGWLLISRLAMCNKTRREGDGKAIFFPTFLSLILLNPSLAPNDLGSRFSVLE